MATEKVRAWFSERGMEDKIMEFTVSSATVALAAEALQVERGRIAKTLSFYHGERVALIVMAGDQKLSNPKFKAFFGLKAKMLSPEDAERKIGHAVGGICPFAVNDGCDVYLDESLFAYDVVYPACGSSNSAAAFAPKELESLLSAQRVDLSAE